MARENILDKVENFLDWSVNSFTESFWFKGAESVGTIRVLDSFPDRKYFPGHDLVILNFGSLKDTDDSPFLYHVPHGIIKEDQIVEVLVKRSRIKAHSEVFLVAVRPFKGQDYGKPFKWVDTDLEKMFSYNLKTSESSRIFYKKFLQEK